MNIKRNIKRAGILALIPLAAAFNSYAQSPEVKINPVVQTQQTAQENQGISENLGERLKSFLASLGNPGDFHYIIKYNGENGHGEIEFRYSSSKIIKMTISQIKDRRNKDTYRLNITDKPENGFGKIDKAEVVFEIGYRTRLQHPANGKELPPEVLDEFNSMYSRGLELVVAQTGKRNTEVEAEFDIYSAYSKIVPKDILDGF